MNDYTKIVINKMHDLERDVLGIYDVTDINNLEIPSEYNLQLTVITTATFTEQLNARPKRDSFLLTLYDKSIKITYMNVWEFYKQLNKVDVSMVELMNIEPIYGTAEFMNFVRTVIKIDPMRINIKKFKRNVYNSIQRAYRPINPNRSVKEIEMDNYDHWHNKSWLTDEDILRDAFNAIRNEDYLHQFVTTHSINFDLKKRPMFVQLKEYFNNINHINFHSTTDMQISVLPDYLEVSNRKLKSDSKRIDKSNRNLYQATTDELTEYKQAFYQYLLFPMYADGVNRLKQLDYLK